jgi:hypothetical protein
MAVEFVPLYVTLVLGGLIAGALAIRWIWKLREGTLHLLGPAEEPEPTPSPASPEMDQTSALMPE